VLIAPGRGRDSGRNSQFHRKFDKNKGFWQTKNRNKGFTEAEACFHLDVEAVLLFLLFLEFSDQVSCCFHLDVEVVLLFFCSWNFQIKFLMGFEWNKNSMGFDCKR
jgi:hypothetical protein